MDQPCRPLEDVGTARLEFAVMVGIFITWILVSVAMFQLSLREADTGGQGTVVLANKPASSKAAPTESSTTSPATPVPRTTEAPQVVEATTPSTTAPSTTAPSTTAPSTTAPATTRGSTTAPTRKAPKREDPTPAASPKASPTASQPGEPAPAAPPPPAPANHGTPTLPTPTTEVSTPSATTTVPVAGPRLVLTASVARKGTLASTLLSGLDPAGTLTEIAITSGRGNLVGMSPNGDYVFEAPNGRDTTVVTFTYTQGGIPVTGNVLTISTD